MLASCTFVETKLFSRLVEDYLSDAEYARVQATLMRDPEAGPVIPGSGGVRKLRWGQPGRGKRGGIRIIYYLQRADGVIWMLTIYAKNEASDIAPETLRRIKDEIDGETQA
jgi:mRNA-degrading endonuclease RelE of RelBE toxin-antitoxin system